jgi:hypothetical protein
MDFTDPQKQTAIIAAAAAIGIGQAIILKKTMDTSMPVLIPQLSSLGSFAKPSAIIGIAGGAGAVILSLFVLKDNKYSNALAAYGGSAMVGGILSGLGI